MKNKTIIFGTLILISLLFISGCYNEYPNSQTNKNKLAPLEVELGELGDQGVIFNIINIFSCYVKMFFNAKPFNCFFKFRNN